MTEEEREAVAREAAARDREVATNWMSRREKDWAVACESAAREAEVRETRAHKTLDREMEEDQPPLFYSPFLLNSCVYLNGPNAR